MVFVLPNTSFTFFLYFSQFDLVSLNFYFAYYLFLFFSACLCVCVYPRYSKSLKQLATRCQPSLARVKLVTKRYMVLRQKPPCACLGHL